MTYFSVTQAISPSLVKREADEDVSFPIWKPYSLLRPLTLSLHFFFLPSLWTCTTGTNTKTRESVKHIQRRGLFSLFQRIKINKQEHPPSSIHLQDTGKEKQEQKPSYIAKHRLPQFEMYNNKTPVQHCQVFIR